MSNLDAYLITGENDPYTLHTLLSSVQSTANRVYDVRLTNVNKYGGTLPGDYPAMVPNVTQMQKPDGTFYTYNTETKRYE